MRSLRERMHIKKRTKNEAWEHVPCQVLKQEVKTAEPGRGTPDGGAA